MDTRLWGPSAWKLFHLVAQNYPQKPTDEDRRNWQEFFISVKNILPCKYCRESFQQFMEELNIVDFLFSRRNLQKWMWLMHNKVNAKLRKQNLLKTLNPTFSEVYKKYDKFLTICINDNIMPGWDFLFSIAFNYPKKITELNSQTMISFTRFIELLPHVLPQKCSYTHFFANYTKHNSPYNSLSNGRNAIVKWIYNAYKELNKCVSIDTIAKIRKNGSENYREICNHFESFRANACTRKNHRGKKTCQIPKSDLLITPITSAQINNKINTKKQIRQK